MGDGSLELLKGTLDVLLLKTLSAGPLHGYAISRSIRNATDDALMVEEGALYPALRRLEKRGMVRAEWGVSETGRDVRTYRMTRAGEAELATGLRTWNRYVQAMARVLEASATG
jgi:PadR family transcriptional regulator